MASEIKGLDEDMGERQITLVTREGDKVEVTEKQCRLSRFIQSALEQDKAATSMPVQVSLDMLNLVVKFFKMHNGVEPPAIPKPLKSSNLRECVSKEDADFVESLSKKELFDLIPAANYLDVPSLLALCIAKVASMIKGSSPEEIRKQLRDNLDSLNKQRGPAPADASEAAASPSSA